MDMTMITGAYTGLKSAKDLFTGLTELKIETATISKINDAVKNVGEAQDALFQLREELFRLQSENDSLKKQITDVESWENKISQYELVTTPGSAVVYKFKETPEHYICPSCISKKVLEILQDNHFLSGTYRCVGCKSDFPIKVAKRINF